ALEPDKYIAAVIIAGGADFYTISDLSNYKYLINAVDFTYRPAPPTDAQHADLVKHYLDITPLDSYHTAAAIRAKPILMIHGDHDGAVPAATGELLWEQLGKPQRWVETAGHEEVFIKLAGQMDQIMQWIADH